MRTPVVITLDRLAEEPYASVICYPSSTPEEIRIRMDELRSLGVKEIEFSGDVPALSLSVLGKGHGGVVVAAHTADGRMALKLRRTDSSRGSMEHEAETLVKVNSVGVGPRFVAATERFLLMQLIPGGPIDAWLTVRSGKEAVRRVLEDILEQCWRLDTIGSDHGELRRASKHILMDGADMPVIVDFETVSQKRNASNVTSVCQFLFQGNSETREVIETILGRRGEGFMDALRRYRHSMDRRNFDDLLKRCIADG